MFQDLSSRITSISRSIFRQGCLLATSAILMLASTPVHADEIKYLSQTWFHRGDNLNLLTTPSRQRLAVDNEGRFIADASVAPAGTSIKYRFDSLYEHDGEFFVGRNLGNVGYDYVSLGKRGNLLTGKQVEQKRLDKQPVFRVPGYHLDREVTRGNIALEIFPEAGIAIVCGQSQWDSRLFDATLFYQGETLPKFDVSSQLPIYTGAGASVRSADYPDRVFVDSADGGFWFLGSKTQGEENRQLMLTYVKPTKQDNGVGKLEHGALIAVGNFATEQFENGIVIGDKLFLLIATEDASVAGVKPQRRLLRIDRKTGDVAETTVSFDLYLDDAKLARLGDDLVVYSPDRVKLVDGKSLEPKWERQIKSGPDDLHSVYRAAGDAKGARLVVATATPYRKAGENSRIIMIDSSGNTTATHDLKPGSIDELTFTDDGGLLVFSDRYTAKIGGDADVQANEAAAIAQAEKAIADPVPAAKEAVADKPFDYVAAPINDRFKIWFDKPAKGFGADSLPIGNGKMGIMLNGGTDKANIVFNVDSHWAGRFPGIGSYQGFGEINLMLGHNPKKVTDYRRELDLRTGLHTVTYTHDGVRYTREAFCSYPAGLFAIRLTADKPGALTGDIELMSNHPATFEKSAKGIQFAGELKGNQRKFRASVAFNIDGGKVIPEAGKSGEHTVQDRRLTATMPYDAVRVEGANSITLYLAADTDYSPDGSKDFRGDDPAKKIAPRLANIDTQSFEQIKVASEKDVATLFDRCTLDLATANPDAEKLPTDRRKLAYRSGASDPGFEALAFAAQRHMMIASSRPGSLPANLQGVWNDSNWPAWTSDYHADINIQMAYWFTEPANLAECNDALFDYIESQIPVRRRIADETYGRDVRGWNVHFMNNIFGGYAYMVFPAGSAWYAQHFAEHFKFNQDKAYLEKRAYPVLKELSEHWDDLLIERPDGTLVSPRTMSPEHKPPQYGISQDMQLVHNLFTDFVAASKRLDKDGEFRQEVLDMRARLLPIKIGRWGQIQEWERDRDSRYSTHRHHHQMIAAFPGSQITNETPELAQAVVTGLEARSRGMSGWSQAWRISLFARVRRPDLAYRQVRVALPNFHNHLIWEGKNQIDAPAGFASGVCEMLLQSHKPLDETDSRFLIELLPSLPDAWPKGTVKGLRARGGYEVDMQWAEGKLLQATIRNVNSASDQATVRYGDRTETLTVPRGDEVVFKR